MYSEKGEEGKVVRRRADSLKTIITFIYINLKLRFFASTSLPFCYLKVKPVGGRSERNKRSQGPEYKEAEADASPK